ncbi:ROK family protein [Streptomyces diastatochromogenes]|nr:ROK family protein [Streptomyces diastatochromogenes]
MTATGTVRLSDSLPEWTGLDLAAEVGRDFDAPVLVENDCNLAALAERWAGVAQQVDDVVFVLSGMRTGCGMLIRGELHRGRRGAAGEIGALPLVGWHRAPAHLAAFRDCPGDPARGDGRPGLRRGQVRRPAARWAVEQFAHDLAEGIAALVLTVDPDLVVLGGGVSRSADVLMEPSAATWTRSAWNRPPSRSPASATKRWSSEPYATPSTTSTHACTTSTHHCRRRDRHGAPGRGGAGHRLGADIGPRFGAAAGLASGTASDSASGPASELVSDPASRPASVPASRPSPAGRCLTWS